MSRYEPRDELGRCFFWRDGWVRLYKKRNALGPRASREYIDRRLLAARRRFHAYACRENR